jgi:hypothetical protein
LNKKFQVGLSAYNTDKQIGRLKQLSQLGKQRLVRRAALIGGNVDGVFESRVSFSSSFPFQLFAIKASSACASAVSRSSNVALLLEQRRFS